MATLITILVIIASVLLILVVLVQNSKGGGLDSSFGSANQLGGAAQSTETIEKATWTLAGAIAVLSLVAAMYVGGGSATGNVETNIKSQGAPAPVSAPMPAPVTAPAE